MLEHPNRNVITKLLLEVSEESPMLYHNQKPRQLHYAKQAQNLTGLEFSFLCNPDSNRRRRRSVLKLILSSLVIVEMEKVAAKGILVTIESKVASPSASNPYHQLWKEIEKKKKKITKQQ